ncbi:hypothetical protein HPB47_018727 [Ixodes persulcatus]|uniref:Uncharacterized protein n=1 Tax=Ixodes persulcatus TaxID=34615 RepID=A0AC60R041_IXOPE|nr:hypothetical protein HPB47_018727 [Ixodes persulcatus]
MPVRRVLAADGLHPSFEAVALLERHYQQIIMKNDNQEPAGRSDSPPTIRIPDADDIGSRASPNTVHCGTQSTATIPRAPQSPYANLRQTNSSLRGDRTPQRCHPTSIRQKWHPSREPSRPRSAPYRSGAEPRRI